MADRYLVATGNYNNNNTWAATSGGAPGASFPVAGDHIIMDANSGAAVLTVNVASACDTVDCTGFTGTVIHAASVTWTIAGNGGVFKLVAGMTYTPSSSTTSVILFSGTSGTMTITLGGKILPTVTLDGVGGTWQLGDAFLAAAGSTLTLTNGTFNANNQNVTTGLFNSSNANVRTLTMGSGTWTLSGVGTVWTTSTTTNLTLNKDTATINLTNSGSSARTFAGASIMLHNLNVTAGNGNLTFTNVSVTDLNFTGYTGQLLTGTGAITVAGNLTFGAGMTDQGSASQFTMTATSGTKLITTNGVNLNRGLAINGVGGTFQLVGNWNGGIVRTLTLTNGTFDANDYNVAFGAVNISNSNVRGLLMGNGIWTLGDDGTIWTATTTTNLTFNAEGSTIKVTSATAATKTIIGGGLTYNNLWYAPGAGTGSLNITGSNTWNDIKDDGSAAHGINFTAGTTNTFTSWTGFDGNLVTIGSITAANHNLVKAGGGTIDVELAAVSRSQASPANTWYASAAATDGGNNSGWTFGAAPGGGGTLLLLGVGV